MDGMQVQTLRGLGELVKSVREARKETQYQVADTLQVSLETNRSAVAHLKQGYAYQNPRCSKRRHLTIPAAFWAGFVVPKIAPGDAQRLCLRQTYYTAGARAESRRRQ